LKHVDNTDLGRANHAIKYHFHGRRQEKNKTRTSSSYLVFEASLVDAIEEILKRESDTVKGSRERASSVDVGDPDQDACAPIFDLGFQQKEKALQQTDGRTTELLINWLSKLRAIRSPSTTNSCPYHDEPQIMECEFNRQSLQAFERNQHHERSLTSMLDQQAQSMFQDSGLNHFDLSIHNRRWTTGDYPDINMDGFSMDDISRSVLSLVSAGEQRLATEGSGQPNNHSAFDGIGNILCATYTMSTRSSQVGHTIWARTMCTMITLRLDC
jgi:hypothetical protein